MVPLRIPDKPWLWTAAVYSSSMHAPSIPIVILAGSDARPAELPEEGRDRHPLTGYKGATVRIGDRSLVEVVIERLEACDRFGPIYVAGPGRAYEDIRQRARLIEADGTLGDNIRDSIEVVRREHPGRALAFITCDIVPDPQSLEALLEDYDRHAPADLWFPLVHAPENPGELGASDWKPAYRIVPREGLRAVEILPGHLAIYDPEALRLKFLYRLIQLGYRTRNRSINYRRGVMVRGLVLELLFQDLMHVLTLRAPTLTWSVLRVGIAAARQLRDGTITRERLEHALRTIFVKSRHRRRYPGRRVQLPIVEALSLALDIDTEEEARAAGGDVTSH
jgi:hypothetical protein